MGRWVRGRARSQGGWPALVVLVAAATGCGSSHGSQIRVLAAASLTEAFGAMGDIFEAENPAVNVTFTFAASSSLARQIEAGAPGDVFVSADESTMRTVVDAGHAADPRVMARNRLTVLVEKGNPKGIRGLADLGRPDVLVALCAPEVPCGRLAAAALQRDGVVVRPVSSETNVKAVAARIILGEADAGIVYATDARAAGDKAEPVPLEPGDPSLDAVYPIAVLRGTGDADAARAWIAFARSEQGQAILARFGFLPP